MANEKCGRSRSQFYSVVHGFFTSVQITFSLSIGQVLLAATVSTTKLNKMTSSDKGNAVEKTAHYFHGEVFVSFILLFFGFFAFLTVDFLKHVYHPGSGSWLHPLLFFGVLAADLAPFLAHYSGTIMYPTYRFWQPLEGGNRFIVFQSFGWFIYSVGILCHIITLVNH